jgi:hypothetical protein
MWSDRRGLMLVVSSPSGAGKTSLCRRLLVDHADLTLSVSWTTRPPRQGEMDGREYHFVTQEAFDAQIAVAASSSGRRCTTIGTAVRARPWTRLSPPAGRAVRHRLAGRGQDRGPCAG